MRDAELKYEIIEKQTYGLVQALQGFINYVLHYPIISYVPNNAVKTILIQTNTYGRRGRWIAKILEFYPDIKYTEMIKGHDLAMFLVESNCKVLRINIMVQILEEKIYKNPSRKFIYFNVPFLKLIIKN